MLIEMKDVPVLLLYIMNFHLQRNSHTICCIYMAKLLSMYNCYTFKSKPPTQIAIFTISLSYQ